MANITNEIKKATKSEKVTDVITSGNKAIFELEGKPCTAELSKFGKVVKWFFDKTPAEKLKM